MFDRIERKLDDWHDRKPPGLLKFIGGVAGTGVGAVSGLTYDGYKFIPTILDQSLLSFGTEVAEGAAVVMLAGALGAAVGYKAGEVVDTLIENPDLYK